MKHKFTADKCRKGVLNRGAKSPRFRWNLWCGRNDAAINPLKPQQPIP
jgi:hypothetical protein